MPEDFKPETTRRWGRVKSEASGRQCLFMAGASRRKVCTGAYFSQTLVTGMIRFANGDEYWAVLDIDESSSGELGGAWIFRPDSHGGKNKEVLKSVREFVQDCWPEMDRSEFYPFRYKYTAELLCFDHHVGDDGWSKPW